MEAMRSDDSNLTEKSFQSLSSAQKFPAHHIELYQHKFHSIWGEKYFPFVIVSMTWHGEDFSCAKWLVDEWWIFRGKPSKSYCKMDGDSWDVNHQRWIFNDDKQKKLQKFPQLLVLPRMKRTKPIAWWLYGRKSSSPEFPLLIKV